MEILTPKELEAVLEVQQETETMTEEELNESREEIIRLMAITD